MIRGATKDERLITSTWDKPHDRIEGVQVQEIKHVLRDHGIITEIYRPEWDPTGLPVVQVYQSRLFPGALGAWSCHTRTIDRLFINQGHVKVVLYDGREASQTAGMINEFYIGDSRPTFVVIPVGVWHGLQNLGATDALMINLPTAAYCYEDPDHWRLPFDTEDIPYTWKGMESATRPRTNPRQSVPVKNKAA